MPASRSHDHVVAGVDNTLAGANGVHYAALEAHRLGVDLHLVRATQGYDDTTPDAPFIDAGMMKAYGQELLEKASVDVGALALDLRVETHLVSGGVVSALVEHARTATLLVLGAEQRSFIGRIWTGDVVAGVAARAACPVVVVAPEWERTDEHHRVVVGVKTVDAAPGLLEAGLALAHAHQAELVILHAWKLMSGYDDIVANRTSAEDIGRQMTSAIEPMVNRLRTQYPDVPVRIEVLHAQPAFALVDASAAADRLLISRPGHGGRLHHLGAVSRAVLHESRCPVEVLPPVAEQNEHDEPV